MIEIGKVTLLFSVILSFWYPIWVIDNGWDFFWKVPDGPC